MILLLIPLCLAFSSVSAQTHLGDLGITVRGESREYAYTNKSEAFLYGETNGENRSSWQGFTVHGREMLDGYTLLIDEARLLPSSALRCTVYPDHLERTYPGGLTEEIRPVDSLDAFAVILRSPRPVEVGVIPWLADVRDSTQVLLTMENELGLVGRKAHLLQKAEPDMPRWLAVYGQGFGPREVPSAEAGRFSPFLLYASRARTRMVVFAAGPTPEAAASLARSLPLEAEQRFAARRKRIEALLSSSPVQTDNRRFNRALAWAKLSLDALVMHQGATGIFAGLPWFDNYWGRDTFISLPGAALVTGRFDEAREILRAFAEYQNRDSASSDFGRIPNYIGPAGRAYNTADGTPRFVLAAKEFLERSGDWKMLFELYPVVVRSIEGTLRYHVDSLGFLTHGDAETWMDAVGPNGPWSPRGNRANDVQALWAGELEAGIWFATRVGDAQGAHRWEKLLLTLRKHFSIFFLQEGLIADRLKADGSPDWTLRPNQLFTAPLLNDDARAGMVFHVASRLTYPYGVASLSQDDENFHPYHQDPPYYPKDAAYHNGTVWTWLQGPLISELCRYHRENLAWQVTTNSVHQILDRGAVGTQSELLDAIPRPGAKEPAISGTFSQAWNLAEFVRNWYDDYLGLRIDLLTDSLTLSPCLPDSLQEVRASVPVEGGSVNVQVRRTSGTERISLATKGIGAILQCSIRFRSTPDSLTTLHVPLPGTSTLVLFRRKGECKISIDGHPLQAGLHRSAAPEMPASLGPLSLARPVLRSDLRALRGPAYPLLSNAIVKASGDSARLFLDAQDPSGDDVGIVPGSNYTYPLNPAFQKGSFDITKLVVRVDTTAFYFRLEFRNLSDPGWHPEYGFQLTFCAIAIASVPPSGTGQRKIPRNALLDLPSERAYDRLILVGGGLRVEDAWGNPLCEYIPVPDDLRNPLGDAHHAVIAFAIPRVYLGTPSPDWRVTVLAGAQDDHGGAGIGEFRTVRKESGEWNGGGKKSASEPNVYDELQARSRP